MNGSSPFPRYMRQNTEEVVFYPRLEVSFDILFHILQTLCNLMSALTLCNVYQDQRSSQMVTDMSPASLSPLCNPLRRASRWELYVRTLLSVRLILNTPPVEPRGGTTKLYGYCMYAVANSSTLSAYSSLPPALAVVTRDKGRVSKTISAEATGDLAHTRYMLSRRYVHAWMSWAITKLKRAQEQ